MARRSSKAGKRKRTAKTPTARELCAALNDKATNEIERLRAHLVQALHAPPQPDAWVKATNKAYALLIAWLNPTQLRQWEKTQSFIAIGSVSGTSYRISCDETFNVHADDGDGYRRYCAVLPPAQLGPPEQPSVFWKDLLGDRLLAQKIMIETDEEKFLEIANRSPTPVSFQILQRHAELD